MLSRSVRCSLTKFALLSLGLSLTIATTGCEGEDLVPTGPNEFPECNGPCESGTLDGGTNPTVDAGTNTGSPDAGTGSPDAGGPPDMGPPPPTFLELSGQHQTDYSINLSSYLFGISNLAGPLDTIDQALAGRVDTGFGFIDDLVVDVIDNYIPAWVGEVVSVLNNVSNLLNDVRFRGTMDITQTPIDEMAQGLAATEQWNNLTLMVIAGCPLGRDDPQYPSCAQNPIPMGAPSAVGPLEVGVDVKPFEGSIEPGVPQGTFMFADREVDIEITKLVTAAIDIGIRIETDGQVQGLDDAIDRSIDCPGFTADASGIIAGIVGQGTADTLAPILLNACEEVKLAARNEIISRIDAIGVGWQVLEFDQHGLAIDRNANNRADTIQDMTEPNTIDGSFKAIGSSIVEGSWQGTAVNP